MFKDSRFRIQDLGSGVQGLENRDRIRGAGFRV